MPPVRTPAIVLHSFAYGDTSRILRILTPEYGVRSLLARGARNPKSRFGAALEPFTEGEAQFNLRPNRDLLTLAGFSLIRSRQGIGRDFLAFAGASLAAELVLRFATDEPQPDLYRVLLNGLDRLATAESDPAAATLSVIWAVVSEFGFQPRMDECIDCGRSLSPDEQARFHADLGGVSCDACRQPGRPLTSATRMEILHLCESPAVLPSLSLRSAHGEVLSSFLSAHVLHGRPLRSLPIYMGMLR